MKLCRTHITMLNKIIGQLSMHQSMTYRQFILGLENSVKVKEAIKLLERAKKILDEID